MLKLSLREIKQIAIVVRATLLPEIEKLFNSRATAPKLLTIKEAAEILSVHPNTVYKLIADGQLPAHKVRRITRIYSDDLNNVFQKEESQCQQ